MRVFYYILTFVFFISPVYVSAQVIINEIAWMGTEASANDEWIELKNTSTSTINISSWVLEAQDGSPKIELNGDILAGGFFLLERTDDSSVPAETADQVYSGALSNSGELLMLKNASNIEVDRVDGSNEWVLGGDKKLKYTLQKSASGWVTAVATPKTENNLDDDTVINNNMSTDISTSTEPEAIDNPEVITNFQQIPKKEKIFIRANAGKSIIAEAGQEIFFDGSASEGEVVSFSWNLGNGEIREKESFLYTYKFPGVYLVTLTTRNGIYKDTSQINVTVYPAGIIISEFYIGKFGKESWIELQNTSDNFIDLSFWKILSDFDEFSIPDGTFLAPFGYLIFSDSVLGEGFFLDSKNISLLYPNGQASDLVSYEFKDSVFSASRKNKSEFVWTKNKTPGFKNITVISEPSKENQGSLDVKNNLGVSSNTIKKNWASFIFLDGQKSFLIKPAKAEVVGVEDDSVLSQGLSKLEISANLSSISVMNLFFIFLAGMITALLAFWLGKRRT
jgi:PKD repeat protein